jgi:D-arabinose 1-dehydrogenase-like Zn-dependent alcohol dehydrogenase
VLGGDFPRILGHEFSGTVRAVGADVPEWRPGDRVTSSFYLTCGHCRYCRTGHETLCANFGGFVGAAIDGAFAEVVRVPASNLVAVPMGAELADAGIVADAIATPLHVLNRRLAIRAGDWVVVIGAGGGLGAHTAAVATFVGSRVIAVESSPAKRTVLAEQGLAELVLDSADDWPTAVADITRTSVRGAVDCVGSADTLASAARALGPGGTLVVLGVRGAAQLTVPAMDFILRELTVTGTRYATRDEIAQGLELVAARRLTPLVGARFPLHELGEAFAAVRAGETFGRIVIDMPASTPGSTVDQAGNSS